MKIAIIGYGRMGREIEKVANNRGHSVIVKVNIDNVDEFVVENISRADVAIEFSTPSTALDNISKCLLAGLPTVSGTTGWLDKYDEAVSIAKEKDTSFLYSSNFNIGVNILFYLNKNLANIMENYADYQVNIEETHHTKKLDAPSGTAINLAQTIISNCSRYNKWDRSGADRDGSINITSVRRGEVPGTHIVDWVSARDRIKLEHEAFSREGFAIGAVFAAEFIVKRKGVFSMNDMLGF